MARATRKRKRTGGRGQGAQLVAGAWQRYQAGDFHASLDLARRAAAAAPADPGACYMLGLACAQLGFYDEALPALEKTLALKPDHAEACRTLGFAYKIRARHDDALALYDRFLNANPDAHQVAAAKASLLMDTGRRDEAGSILRAVVDRDDADLSVALAWAEFCKRDGRPEEGVPRIERFLERADLYPAARTPALHLLGELHDRAGRYDEAFRCFEQANSVRTTNHDRAEHSRAVDAMLGAWSRQTYDRIQSADVPEACATEPVFIVGMPRSGTTLVEQILASHPRVHGAGELDFLPDQVSRLESPLAPRTSHLLLHPNLLTPITLGAIAGSYMRGVRSLAPPGSERITDKMPGNIFNLPLIRKALPHARIIWCRRDPRDTGLSCFFHNFSGLTYVCDLADIGAMIRDERAAGEHFTGRLGIDVLRVEYEDVVADVEGAARRLVEFCGLEWDDRCVKFYETKRDARTLSTEQVQRPIYTSSLARWKHYEDHIAPLVEAMGPGVLDPYA